jgi:hypothetical protein
VSSHIVTAARVNSAMAIPPSVLAPPSATETGFRTAGKRLHGILLLIGILHLRKINFPVLMGNQLEPNSVRIQKGVQL